MQLTEKEILNRYKSVIHMVTAAEGASASYNYTVDDSSNISSENEVEGLKVRKESP